MIDEKTENVLPAIGKRLNRSIPERMPRCDLKNVSSGGWWSERSEYAFEAMEMYHHVQSVQSDIRDKLYNVVHLYELVSGLPLFGSQHSSERRAGPGQPLRPERADPSDQSFGIARPAAAHAAKGVRAAV